MTPEFSTRDQSEIERSASEASKIVVKPVDVDRYLNPQANTPFALEYAFYLLGNVQGKVVLDLGCGSGETLIPLIRRGASLIGIDLSPDLIAIARRRLSDERLSATTYVGSAYETNLSNNSVDVIFCMSLIHHLDIATVREEMRRILRPGGVIVLQEPIRFSKAYAFLRSLLPAHEDISEFEHPLTKDEFRTVQAGFLAEGLRFFRLPFVPLLQRTLPAIGQRSASRLSSWILTTFPAAAHYATVAVLRLKKTNSAPNSVTTYE
ncbi:MAG: methyltransferase domain-containing protein [Terriglobales bacterium]